MSEMDVEKEICQAVNMSPPDALSEEERQSFLRVLVLKADKLSDDEFFSLSERAQEWLNESIERISQGKQVRDFKSAPKPKEDREEIVEKVVKARKGIKSKSGSAKKIVGMRVKELLLEYGVSADYDLISKRLKKEGLHVSKSTFQMIRYEFKQTLALLKYQGHIKPHIGGY